jgi:hypothetical protein
VAQVMNENQLIVFGGVVGMLILRQPLFAVAWILAVWSNALSKTYYLQGLLLFLLIALWLKFQKVSEV